MKKVFALMLMTAFTIMVFAGETEAQKSKNPKATNYKEVLQDMKYPTVCREKGIEGTVLVVLRISDTGDLVDYKFKSAPCDELKEEVENSLKKMTFEPAVDQQGQAVVGKLTLPVVFKLSI